MGQTCPNNCGNQCYDANCNCVNCGTRTLADYANHSVKTSSRSNYSLVSHYTATNSVKKSVPNINPFRQKSASTVNLNFSR